MRVRNINELKNLPLASAHKVAIANALNNDTNNQREAKAATGTIDKSSSLKVTPAGDDRVLQHRLSMLLKADDFLKRFSWHMDYQRAVPGRKFEIDFADPEFKIGLELDGYQFHGKHKKDFYRDREKDYMLSMNGWQVYRVQAGLLYKDPAMVMERARAFVKHWQPRQKLLRQLP